MKKDSGTLDNWPAIILLEEETQIQARLVGRTAEFMLPQSPVDFISGMFIL